MCIDITVSLSCLLMYGSIKRIDVDVCNDGKYSSLVERRRVSYIRGNARVATSH